MTDAFGRKIEYLRISITDRCNLRCIYCMPHGVECFPMSEILTYEEIGEIVKAAASLGISRLKITGGEPLVRRGCASLITGLKAIEGIEEVTLTTNGVLLSENLSALKTAGIDGINISLDTLDRNRFKSITGSDSLKNVLQGLEDALSSGIPVKVNSVLQPGINDDEWPDLIMLAKDAPLDVRFIEIMPIGQGTAFNCINNELLLEKLSSKYPGISYDSRRHGNGPAKYYNIPGFTGSIGFISAVHGRFCASCNRIRLTSMGRLKPCLCFGEAADLKKILRDHCEKDRMNYLIDAITKAIMNKPEQHCFENRSMITEDKKMAAIGG